MTFYNNIFNLCKKNGISPEMLRKELHLSNSTITAWKRNHLPNVLTCKKIAERLNCTIEDLIQNVEK